MSVNLRLPEQDQLKVDLQSLEYSVASLDLFASAEAVDRDTLERLEMVGIKLSLIRSRLRMQKGLIHLSGQFGRAP